MIGYEWSMARIYRNGEHITVKKIISITCKSIFIRIEDLQLASNISNLRVTNSENQLLSILSCHRETLEVIG